MVVRDDVIDFFVGDLNFVILLFIVEVVIECVKKGYIYYMVVMGMLEL